MARSAVASLLRRKELYKLLPSKLQEIYRRLTGETLEIAKASLIEKILEAEAKNPLQDRPVRFQAIADAVRDALCECDKEDTRDLADVLRSVLEPIRASGKALEVATFGGDGYHLTLSSTAERLGEIAENLAENGMP